MDNSQVFIDYNALKDGPLILSDGSIHTNFVLKNMELNCVRIVIFWTGTAMKVENKRLDYESVTAKC
jgi:hypothetical protein